MKILHINSIGGRTGSAKLCEIIVDGLKKNGIDSHTIVGYDFSNSKNNTIESIFFTKSNLIYTYIYKFFVGLNFLFDYMRPGFLSYSSLKKNTYYKDCDIIHIHCPEGGYFDRKDLPKICSEKKVVMILGDRIASGNDSNNYFFWKTKRSFIKRMKILQHLNIDHISISDRSFRKGKNICGLKNIKTIYNGINTNKFFEMDKKKCREKLGLPIDKKIILSIAGSGSKSKLKGIEYVENIVSLHKSNESFLFISLGNGSTQKSESYRELGLIPYDQINLYYNAVDCFLYPSLADNCPLVILECLACGCPVVTFDVGGIPEIVQHKKNGYIAKYKDFNDLITGFEWVMENKDTLDIALDPKFTQENMVNQYIDLYKSLI